jgi:hypothetical protein
LNEIRVPGFLNRLLKPEPDKISIRRTPAESVKDGSDNALTYTAHSRNTGDFYGYMAG